MKKTLLITTFLAAGAIGLFAQGKVSFDNQVYNFPDSIENGGGVDYKVYYAGGFGVAGQEIGDPSWTAQLFQGGNAIGAKIPFYDTASGSAGVWNTGADGTDAGLRTLGTAAGVQTILEVGIFDGAGMMVGKSAPFNYTPPTGATPPPDAFFISNFRGFAVPEPSTVALGVLGLGALLLFRRRK